MVKNPGDNFPDGGGLFWSNQYSRGQIAHLIDEAEDTLDI
jgi:hypothetical protein